VYKLNYREKSYLLALFTIIVIGLTIGLGSITITNIRDVSGRWTIYDTKAANSSFYLNQIHVHLVYGGFIHNFKNYVLRHDQTLEPVILKNLDNIYDAIDQLEALAIDQDEKIALMSIRETIDDYAGKFKIAKQSIADGHTPRQIDAVVKVDDTAALKAMSKLASLALQRNTNMKTETNKAINNTVDRILLGWILIPVMLLYAGILLLFLRRLVVTEEQLRSNEKQLTHAQRIAKLGSWEIGLLDKSLNFSDQTMDFLGIKQKNYVESYDELLKNVHPEDRESVKKTIQAAIEKHEPYTIEHRILRKNGEEAYVREQGEIVTDKDKNIEKLVGTMLDITSYKEAQTKLLHSSALFEKSSDAIVISDASNHILAANKAYTKLTGYSEDEALGKNPGFTKSHRHGREFYEAMWKSINDTDRWEGEIWDRRKNGEAYPKWLSITALRDADGQICNYVAIFTDVSDLRTSEDRLWRLAHHDSLTGLPNRLLFVSKLDDTVKRASRLNEQFALMFIDMDHFKTINDKLGHIVGDMFLKECAIRFLTLVRDSDTVARIGGDEFVILLDNINNADNVPHIINKIVNGMKPLIKIENNDIQASMSIGVAIFPQHGNDAQTLLKNADTAMYEVKAAGRNGVQMYKE